MLTVIVFIIILGLLIFVHELGHFLVALRNGIKAEEFGFGFPPRILGFVKDDETGKYKLVPGHKHVESENTIYSINWIPLGGFVKIKGEDGIGDRDPDSFASRPAWTRTKVLAAGVIMNFIFAWVLISIALMIGAPEAIDDSVENISDTKIQISQVIPDSPADEMGLKVGDEILGMTSIAEVKNFVSGNGGGEIMLNIKRGKDTLELKGVPREEYPKEQGPLGVSLVKTAIISYPWYEAIWKGLVATYELIIFIIVTLCVLIRDLILGRSVAIDIAGPVGIAVLTHQVTTLGLVYILQFAAILSINLGIINGLPIPALDGGRILFIIIEKIKGSPVSQKVEQMFHTVGFTLLIALMLLVTFKDLMRFDIIGGIKGLF